MIQIAENVWQIPVMPRQSVNCYLMGDVLVDAGVKRSGPKLLRALQGKAVSGHALTHAHPDHQGATADVCKALNLPLMCHAEEREAAETGHVLGSFPNPGSLMARMQQRFFAGAGHPVARVLAEGDQVGGFEVIETPGHTRGHISFWRASDGVLIAGDAVVGMNLLTTRPQLGLPLGIATWDMEVARQSIAKLAALSPRKVAFGHGPAVDGAALAAFADSLG
ncbi:MBL fold metallo-hydrolase [uncultured Tateyamaria sp.]|uniref:MBL fold metallo-hydrolase n=1 Tax=uncultured Tateyamaria sp. TaxID=455651 RepID=UPI00262FA43C|nr:MBL fold metallo-hydrolase [uncultured Tateyamaria sp.]